MFVKQNTITLPKKIYFHRKDAKAQKSNYQHGKSSKLGRRDKAAYHKV
ncbi:MAG: hypothetical protein POELPBGB_02826 [Bacteroidia bacterium]|nr:hypothetical protein [Bacteroidia bacterium]